MSLFDKLNPLKAVLDVVRGTIDDLHTSDEEKSAAKLALLSAQHSMEVEVLKFDTELVKASRDVLMAEIAGKSWMQRNWRPTLMFAFIAILVNNYILAPYIPGVVPLEFPSPFWGLLTVSVGGYIGARTYEKKLETTKNGTD